jgi:chromosome partitioning protein
MLGELRRAAQGRPEGFARSIGIPLPPPAQQTVNSSYGLKFQKNCVANTDRRSVVLFDESPQCGLADKQTDQNTAKGAPLMSAESFSAPGVRVIVVANEKGGSGKSTVAVHLAIALLRAGQSVATIDLDTTQRSFTHYIDNRLAWSRQRGLDLPTPTHVCFSEDDEFASLDGETGRCAAFAKTVGRLADTHACIIVDTPGHDSAVARLALTFADTLITPLNDSFVDLDSLGSVDPETFRVSGISRYARVVEEARSIRSSKGRSETDWIVLRNRLSMLNSRNKRLVDSALHELSQRLGFRYVEGLAERVIFREFYPRGLTAADALDEATLGTRPTMSHATAQLEVQALIGLLLGAAMQELESPELQADVA